jgi:putative two-component system response regulator
MQAQRPANVLIVDDNTSFLAAACLTLTRCRHVVVSCSTGSEARLHMDRMPFDAVLCGEQLGDETGRELCHFIKSSADLDRISVALLLHTPHGSDESSAYLGSTFGQECNRGTIEPDDYILKSAYPEELLFRVQNLVRLRRYLDEIHHSVHTLMSLAEGMEEQDRRTRGHCKRLSIMALELGAVMGCNDWQLTTLERAGYLHDVGKARISGALMEKSAPLSPREMEIIKNHCALGEKMCQNVAALRGVLPIIRSHHERADGSGYPDGLRADRIPFLAQIFSIVDVYEALRIWRPYRRPMSDAEAIELMRQEVLQGLWNPKIFEGFAEHVLPGLEDRIDAAHVLWPRS